MTTTSIEWTDYSWNPVRARVNGKVGWHCEKVSPGCTHCYAERLNKRLGTGEKYDHRGRVATFLSETILTEPLRWRKPRKVFVCSMSDLFGEWVPDEWIDRIFAVMAMAPQHTYQCLTKRAKRMREYMTHGDVPFRVAKAADSVGTPQWPLPGVWAGVSAEDQQRLDERVPELIQTPAAVRFVSAEPLLGPLSFEDGPLDEENSTMGKWTNLDFLQWVIVGGESGPGARPMDIAWARDIVRQCRGAAVPCFVKQMGRVWAGSQWAKEGNPPWDRKGGDPSEWPEDLRVREWPA